MKIVYLCNEYPPSAGGIGVFTQTIARAMANRGHQVSVIGTYSTLTQPQVEMDQKVNVTRIAHMRSPFYGFLLDAMNLQAKLDALSRTSGIDIVEGSESSFGFLRKSVNYVKVVRLHGGHNFFRTTLHMDVNFWSSWVERRSIRNADAICAVSHFTAAKTSELLSLDRTSIQILPNPIDTDLFSNPLQRLEETGLCVFAGTLREKKGIAELINAMKLVIDVIPYARLLIIGSDTKDKNTGRPYSESLKRSIPPSLKDKITFHAAVDHKDLPLYFARAQVCVFPSHMETQGLVIGEAMAMGKAVVTSRVGPIPEFVEDDIDGLLCNPHDPQSIAEHIIQLLVDSELRDSLGRAGRKRVVNGYSLDVLVERNEQYYTQLLGEQ